MKNDDTPIGPSGMPNLTGRPPLTEAERVLIRAQSLKNNKGRWWSLGIAQAAGTLKREQG